MIQIFIRVVFRCVGRQEEHLHLLLVLLQPGRSKLAVMHLKIIQISLASKQRDISLPAFLAFFSKVIRSNQMSRKRENSILRSVGLTGKQLCRMNICEGLCLR